MLAGFWDKEVELCRVAKSKTAFYSFKAVEKNGKSFIDIREHFERIDGSIQHTAKGISVPTAMFVDMAEGFNEALRIYTSK